MKYIKINLAISLLAILMLSLAACAEISAGAAGVSGESSSYARAAQDTKFTGPNALNGADSNSSHVVLKYKGTVDAVTVNTLTLNGQTFSVATTDDLTTLFTPGSTFEIELRQNGDGTISIDRFMAVDDSGEYDVEFKGLVDTVTPNTITLNGETLTAATTDDLTALFTPGEVYEIKYLFNADGTISIVAFHSEGDNYDVEFKGLVEAVTADTLTLNGETFTVATTNDLTALFTPGEMYEIKYLFNADGTITIVDFHFEDGDDLNDDSSDDDWDNSSDDDNNSSDDDSSNNDDDHDNNNDDNNHNNNDDHNNNNNDN